MDRRSTGTNEMAIAVDAPAIPRRRLAAAGHFTRHLAEMVIAMLVGMGLLGMAIQVLGTPPGYDNPLVEYGLMGVAMAIPMVGWMRFRGHSWADGLEMTVAMLLPLLALLLPSALGLGGPTGHSLMMLSHLAMIAGMAVLMLFRWDRYAHGAHNPQA